MEYEEKATYAMEQKKWIKFYILVDRHTVSSGHQVIERFQCGVEEVCALPGAL